MSASPGEIARELEVDPAFDAGNEIERRVAFLADALIGTDTQALVLGVSGGVDSATAGRLCQLAAERARRAGHDAAFVAMRLPYGVQHDEPDAQAALAFIRPDRILTVDIGPASDSSLRALLAGGLVARDDGQQDLILGNIKARERMIAQYAAASASHGLVVGTDHAAEAITGFFTKYGDGAADLVPMTGLTKRRVRALAEALGAPPALIHKVPTADLESLHPGRPDEEVLGFSYDDIDDFLEGKPVRPEVAELIARRFQFTAHKRRLPLGP